MQKNLNTLIITGDHIQEIIQHIGIDSIMDQLIEESYKAFVNFDAEDSLMTARSGFNYQEPREGLVEWMPIRKISDEEVLIKVVGYHPQNPEAFKLPTILSSVSTYDTKTGHLKALIDGVLPTSLRTGAISAIASKLLGNSKSSHLGLIGCGAQSVTQLHAISRVFPLKKVFYYDSDASAVQSFPSRVEMLNLDCELISTDIEMILSESDIISTATSIGIGEGPLFEHRKTKDHLHINAIGSDFPGKFELPLEFLKQSYVCPDWLDQATIEGECQQLALEDIGENLSDCLKGADKLNHLKDKLTVFDSTGIALQDLVAANVFLKHAAQLNLGHNVIIENPSIDEKNPYAFLKRLKES